MKNAALLIAIIASPLAIGLAQTAPSATWSCTGKNQTVHDSNGETNEYTERLPGDAWNDDSAAGEAAENYHRSVSCKGCPAGETGCTKFVDWSYDVITMVTSQTDGGAFKFTIKNFKVWGNFSVCE